MRTSSNRSTRDVIEKVERYLARAYKMPSQRSNYDRTTLRDLATLTAVCVIAPLEVTPDEISRMAIVAAYNMGR